MLYGNTHTWIPTHDHTHPTTSFTNSVISGVVVFFPFNVRLRVISPYQADICRTTASFNAPGRITKTNHKPQCIQSNRERWTSTSDTSHSQLYSFLIKFSGQSIQLKVIAIYNSLEALGTLQVHQVSYFEILLYLDVLISHIRPTVS